MIIENFIELVDIIDIENLNQYKNMIDLAIEDDESFLLANGIISHNSAAGSVKQARNSECEAVYALKGKIKNARKLSDLSNNQEILEIMSILDIEPNNPHLPSFEKVIIATDEDCIDENHLVITKKGNKKIKDITYEDKILTHTGEYKDVEKIIESKKENCVEIEINDEKIICSENHILIVSRNNKIQEIFAKDLRKTDFLLLKNEENLTNYKLTYPSNIHKIKKELTMYDITVKDDHTFYIYLNDNTKVLAHNCDGHHISSLVINLFQRWFPQVIKDKRLYRLITPLVGCNIGKERKYFYTLSEYNEFIAKHKVTNVSYFKGLGSLSLEDWHYIMDNKTLFQIITDSGANKYLDIAFGNDSERRKKWLSSAN